MLNSVVPIALDAMGGDFGCSVTVPAAVIAAQQNRIPIVLVGNTNDIQNELDKIDSPAKNLIRVVESQGVVHESEAPAEAFRSKPKASVFVCAGLAKAGKVQGFVSMGSTGATVAAASIVYGSIEGIDRPALGGPIIGYSPNTIILDLGTNLDTRPSRMVDFAVLGTVMSKILYNVEAPSIGILSVGAEEGKGNRQVKETTNILKNSHLNFIGNVEGKDLVNCKADVVICDGFVGNVILKLTEAIGTAIYNDIAKSVSDKAELTQIRQLIAEKTTPLAIQHGGGPLLGVKGIAIVGHGASNAQAIANAISTAKRVVELDFVQQQINALAKLRNQSVNGGDSYATKTK